MFYLYNSGDVSKLSTEIENNREIAKDKKYSLYLQMFSSENNDR